jgi:sugar phosphate isomerase/epimerase
VSRALSILAWLGVDLPLDERLREIRRCGFDAVAIWWGGHETAVDSPGRHDIPRRARDAGLGIDHFHADLGSANHLWSTDRSLRETAVNRHIEWLDDCVRHRVPVLVAHTAKGQDCPAPNDEGVEAFRRIADAARDRGVVVAVENTRHMEHLERVLREIKSPGLRFCYDVAHARLWAADPLDLIAKHAERLERVHFVDTDGADDVHWIPGRGVIDWTAVCEALRKARFEGPVSLEVFMNESDSLAGLSTFLENAAAQARWLKPMLERNS